MNERVRELVKQAWAQRDLITATRAMDDAFTDKFAELIVQECISCLNDSAQQAGDVRTTVGTVEKILKQHFGVAE